MVIAFFAKWVLAAVVLMAAVALVSPKNPRNTLSNGLVVSALLALAGVFLHSFLAWILILPALVGVVLWFAALTSYYGIGLLQSIGVGVVASLLGWGVDLLLLGAAR